MPRSFRDVFGHGWRSMLLEQRLIGEHIYWRDIRHLVIDDHVGEIVAIDTRSGNWALGKDSDEASQLLLEKCPGISQTLLFTVGIAGEDRAGDLNDGTTNTSPASAKNTTQIPEPNDDAS